MDDRPDIDAMKGLKLKQMQHKTMLFENLVKFAPKLEPQICPDLHAWFFFPLKLVHKAPTARHPLRHPGWAHKDWPGFICKFGKLAMRDWVKCRPHAVRIAAVLDESKNSSIATCHMFLCNAPWISSTTSSGGGIFATSSDESDVPEDAESDDSPSSAMISGSGTSGGIAGFDWNWKNFQSTSCACLLKHWSWKSGSSMGAWPPRDSGVTGLKPCCTAWMTAFCNSNEPCTSSRLYSRTEAWEALWWPCNRLWSSGSWSWTLHESNVLLSPWTVYDLTCCCKTMGFAFHGNVNIRRTKNKASA